MSDAWRWLGFALGVVVLLGTLSSLLRTLVVPRGLTSRLVAVVERSVRAAFLFVAARFEDYSTKDRVLVLLGPTMLLSMLLTWLFLLWLGFSLLLWPLIDSGFGEALRESGSSMLTLGFASTPGLGPTIVYLAAAAIGLIVVALQIAYLPTFYAAFNRRETLVTMLQSRAGSPAWGPEILARHQLVGILDNLPGLYDDWETWAADVAESHSSYPILINFRSPHPLRNWVVGLLAVLDSAALYNALSPERAPSEARLCIRMGFNCLRDIADAIGLKFERDPFPDDPIELSFEDFLGGVHRLEEVDFPMERTPEEAWPHFKGWRVNYEELAYSLADRVVATPGPWSGHRKHLPDLEIVPQRPADRQPGSNQEEARPRGTGVGW